MRRGELVALLCAAALGTAGCAGRPIVRAAPASVSTPPPVVEAEPPPPRPVAPPAEQPAEEPAPEVPAAPIPLPAPAKRPPPPRPRPSQAEVAEPAPPKPVPPQISPQLSATALEAAKNNTTSNITTAEKNLHQADGKRLSAAQKDLTEKIKGFLSQAHEAILADDWVRAQNLAEKARVLSAELVKSF